MLSRYIKKLMQILVNNLSACCQFKIIWAKIEGQIMREVSAQAGLKSLECEQIRSTRGHSSQIRLNFLTLISFIIKTNHSKYRLASTQAQAQPYLPCLKSSLETGH